MKGSTVISALITKLRVNTDQALSDWLGETTQAIHYWKNRSKVTPRQIAGVVHKAWQAAADDVQAHAIRPVVEFLSYSQG